jgi:hypothetical protein
LTEYRVPFVGRVSRISLDDIRKKDVIGQECDVFLNRSEVVNLVSSLNWRENSEFSRNEVDQNGQRRADDSIRPRSIITDGPAENLASL